MYLNYLKQIGLSPTKNRKQFWQYMKSKHPSHVVEAFLEMVDRRSAGDYSDPVYEMKNINLEFSLDFAKTSYNFYKETLKWIENNRRPHLSRILEVGCDNGVVTCYLAMLYPEAEVVGVDLSSNGIQCANELAKQLNLHNVKFIRCDFQQVMDHVEANSFDFVFSSRFWHEIHGMIPDLEPWSLSDVISKTEKSEPIPTLDIWSNLLRDESSVLVSVERISHYLNMGIWATYMERNHLKIDWLHSSELKCTDFGDDEIFPILILNKSPQTSSLEDIYGFYLPKDELNDGSYYTGIRAERWFQRCPNKHFVEGKQFDFNDDSGSLRLELWETGEQILLYIRSNKGYREIRRYQLTERPKAEADSNDECENYEMSAKVSPLLGSYNLT